MKPRIPVILLFAPILALSLLFGAQGCQSRTAAKTLLSIGESVNGAMNIYGEMYRAGVLDADEIAEVRQKHATFQAAYKTATALVETDLSELAPQEVADLAFDLILLINQLKTRHPQT